MRVQPLLLSLIVLVLGATRTFGVTAADPVTLQNGNISLGDVALGTKTSGNYVASVATSSPLSGGAAGSEGATLTLGITDDTITPNHLADTMTLDATMTWALGAYGMTWTVANPASPALDIDATGAFASDLVHIHQQTGNPTGGNLLHVEANDPDVSPLLHIDSNAPSTTAGSVVSLLIDTDDNDDASFVPLEIRDNNAGTNDLLFQITSTGTIATGILGANVTASTPPSNDNDTSPATSAFVSSSTVTLTNKSYDAEGTGNVLTIPSVLWIPAATCSVSTATANWDVTSLTAPAPACVAGTNNKGAYLDFDKATDECVQTNLMLPADWTGALDVTYKWLTTATTGNVAWCSQFVCIADGETDDAAFPAQASGNCVSDAAKGTTNQTNDVSDTGVTTTGTCAAGELLRWRLCRDADETATLSDSLDADARLIGAALTLRRAM